MAKAVYAYVAAIIALVSLMALTYNQYMVEKTRLIALSYTISSLSERLTSLSTTISRLKETKSLLESSVTSLKESYESATSRIAQLEEKTKSLEEQLTSLREELRKARMEAQKYLQEYKALQANYTRLVSKYRSLEEKAKRLEEEVKSYKVGYEEAERKYSQLKQEYQKLKDEYNKLEEEYEKLKDKYSRLREEYEGLEEKYNSLKEKYSTLQDKYYSLKEEYESVREENERLKNKISELEEKINTLEKELKELKSKQPSYNLELKKLRGELDNLKSLVYSLYAAIGYPYNTTILDKSFDSSVAAMLPITASISSKCSGYSDKPLCYVLEAIRWLVEDSNITVVANYPEYFIDLENNKIDYVLIHYINTSQVLEAKTATPSDLALALYGLFTGLDLLGRTYIVEICELHLVFYNLQLTRRLLCSPVVIYLASNGHTYVIGVGELWVNGMEAKLVPVGSESSLLAKMLSLIPPIWIYGALRYYLISKGVMRLVFYDTEKNVVVPISNFYVYSYGQTKTDIEDVLESYIDYYDISVDVIYLYGPKTIKRFTSIEELASYLAQHAPTPLALSS